MSLKQTLSKPSSAGLSANHRAKNATVSMRRRIPGSHWVQLPPHILTVSLPIQAPRHNTTLNNHENGPRPQRERERNTAWHWS
jgi:hypothetical protein